MIYLTYSDPLTGVFQSQVIDVCIYLSKTFNIKVRLVTIISIKGFWKSRKQIKSLAKNAIVLPMFPTLLLWKLNAITLFFTFLFAGERAVIARGVLACNMALILKSFFIIDKICYDGRAAVSAEYTEYDVSPYRSMVPVVKRAEKKAVEKSDFRISVSSELIKYWERNFNYTSDQHVIIPSTINSNWKQKILNDQEKKELRIQLGLSTDKIIIVYSGSTAGWQSFDLMRGFVTHILEKQSNVQFLFLSQSAPQLSDLHKRFKNNFVEKWIGHEEVEKYLKVCDFGILIRDESVTNQVASPVKFAEYLFSGLNVLVSANIGDISKFVAMNNCGYVIDKEISIDLNPVNEETRIKNKELAINFFTKESHFSQYKICFDFLMNKE